MLFLRDGLSVSFLFLYSLVTVSPSSFVAAIFVLFCILGIYSLGTLS